MSKKNETKNDSAFTDSFLNADINVEDPAFGSMFPVVQWVNGSPKAAKEGGIAYTGGFFMSADQGVEALPGFEPYNFINDDGDEVAGFAASSLTVSPIQYRRCWQVKSDDTDLMQRFAWSEYEEAEALGRPSGRTHLLVALENCDEPVLLSFGGMVAKAMLGQGRGERGLIPEYAVKVVKVAGRVARKNKMNKNFPLCAFRLTIGPDTEDGKPKYSKVGSGNDTSNITKPVWLDEPESVLDENTLAKLYVGNERLAIYQDWHREADAWRDQWSAETLAAMARRPAPAGAHKQGGENSDGAEGGLPGQQHNPF